MPDFKLKRIGMIMEPQAGGPANSRILAKEGVHATS